MLSLGLYANYSVNQSSGLYNCSSVYEQGSPVLTEGVRDLDGIGLGDVSCKARSFVGTGKYRSFTSC